MLHKIPQSINLKHLNQTFTPVRTPFPFFCSLLLAILAATSLSATTTTVSSEVEFATVHSSSVAGDTILWANGTYADVYMNIRNAGLTVLATTPGQVVFNGVSRVEISADDLTFSGFQFVGGRIGSLNVISVSGRNIKLSQLNIRSYTCHKYLIVSSSSQYVDISYSNFESRVNYADQNILSILVSSQQPGYNTIRHCSFKNFPGNGGDEGVEPIRIGVSSQADFTSRSLVEYCYFTQCDGDGEIISSKASQNVYRFNTFDRNLKAELVLRHGSDNIVYGNFFLNGRGGVRVREGQRQYIYNNYFYRLSSYPIFLQDEPSDPLEDINIAFNTIIDANPLRLGGTGSAFQPQNVTLANNLVTGSFDPLFRDASGQETWLGNQGQGTLGITQPDMGLTLVDPMLVESDDLPALSAASPALDAAVAGYANLPQYPGMATIDTAVMFDLLGQSRPEAVMERDLGATEFPYSGPIRPIATEENTGPSYNSSELPVSVNTPQVVNDALSVAPNPTTRDLTLTVKGRNVTVDLLDARGSWLRRLGHKLNAETDITIQCSLADLSAGIYLLRATGHDGQQAWIQTQKVVKQ